MRQDKVARDRKDPKEVRNTEGLRGNKEAKKNAELKGAPAELGPRP